MTPVRMLSEDDLNLSELTDDELIRAWNLWFELAQSTNEWDPPYSHGVFADAAPGPVSTKEDQVPSRDDRT